MLAREGGKERKKRNRDDSFFFSKFFFIFFFFSFLPKAFALVSASTASASASASSASSTLLRPGRRGPRPRPHLLGSSLEDLLLGEDKPPRGDLVGVGQGALLPRRQRQDRAVRLRRRRERREAEEAGPAEQPQGPGLGGRVVQEASVQVREGRVRLGRRGR